MLQATRRIRGEEVNQMSKAPILLSVVIPFTNFDGGARAMIENVVRNIAPLVDDYEVIIVDNGASPESFAELEEATGPGGIANLQIYRLIQQVEDDIAAWAGIENSLGDYVLVYDPRSENLSKLPEALAEIERGREVVFLRNTSSTDHGVIERLFGGAFRWFFRHITGIDLARDAALGRVISKRVVSYLLQQPYPGLRYRALPALAGFPKTTLTYAMPRLPAARRSFMARARAAIRLTVSTSTAPLRIVSAVALIAASLNALYSFYVVAIALVKRDVAPGWTTISLQQSGMFLLLSLVMFALTEYLIYMIRWTSSGPSYFLASERTSETLTRRQKLNVETAIPPRQPATSDQA